MEAEVSKKKSKRKLKPKCFTCKGPLETPDGFAASIGNKKICVTCALKLVSQL